jgi:hypothetical protein
MRRHAGDNVVDRAIDIEDAGVTLEPSISGYFGFTG